MNTSSLNLNTPEKPCFFVVTGVSGSGKSYACNIFKQLGIHIISADAIAREVVKPNNVAYNEIVSSFGKTILLSDGTIDRKKLSQLVFKDQALKAKLESITHPQIKNAFNLELINFHNNKKNKNDFCFYDIPLFFEVNYIHPNCIGVILVAASKDTCIQRIMSRDQITKMQATLRINSQIPIEEKIKKSDFVLFNDKIELLNVTNIDSYPHAALPLEEQANVCLKWANSKFLDVCRDT